MPPAHGDLFPFLLDTADCNSNEQAFPVRYGDINEAY